MKCTSKVKNIYSWCGMSRVRIRGASGRRSVRPCHMQQRTVFRCALKVVMVAELFITGDRELQTAGAVVLNAFDWKLIPTAGRRLIDSWWVKVQMLCCSTRSSQSQINYCNEVLCGKSGNVREFCFDWNVRVLPRNFALCQGIDVIVCFCWWNTHALH